MRAWLDRLREERFELDTPPLLSPLSPDPSQAGDAPEAAQPGLGEKRDKSGGVSAETAPAADAPAGLWRSWFDRQIQLIDEDLAVERASLARELRTLQRRRQRKLTQEEQRRVPWVRSYRAERTALLGMPEAPCTCGDRVWYQLFGDTSWRCRACEAPDARWRVRWFVL